MAVEGDLNCREAARLMSLRRERELTPDERAALRRHLAACLACSSYEQQIEFIAKAAARFRQ